MTFCLVTAVNFAGNISNVQIHDADITYSVLSLFAKQLPLSHDSVSGKIYLEVQDESSFYFFINILVNSFRFSLKNTEIEQ